MSLLNKEKMRKTKKRKYDLLCDKENTTQGATAGKKAHKVDLWEIKSQSGFGVPKRDAAIIRQAAAVSVRKFLELLKICQKSRNLSKTPFPVLLRLLAVCPTNTRGKKLDICKFTRLVANLHGCALNQSIPPFVSDGGKERRSFKFFRREIRGVRIEKSGAALAQIHTPLPARHHHYSRST